VSRPENGAARRRGAIRSRSNAGTPSARTAWRPHVQFDFVSTTRGLDYVEEVRQEQDL
jgi:hypothetical protein